MKQTNIILPALLISANSLFSQSGTTAVSMGQEFAELAAHGGLSGKGFAAFQSYSSNQVDGSQFFFPEWSTGEVVTIRKEIYNEGLQFIYDKVRQELFVRSKDSSLILLTNKDEIQSFSLRDANNKQYNFVNSKLFTDEKPQVFYQVIIYDSAGISLFKYTKTTFVKADMTDMLKVKDGYVNDAYVDKHIYYIAKAGVLSQPFLLKSKSLKKAFQQLQVDSEKFMNEHPGMMDESYLVDLVKSLNK